MNTEIPGRSLANETKPIKPTLLRPALTLSSTDALHLYRQALAAGIIIHAEYIAQQIAEAWPDDLDAQLALLDSYINTRPGETADDFVEGLQRRFPSETSVLKESAKYYQAEGNGEHALQLLAQARNLDPADPEITFLIGVSHAAMGSEKQAVNAYEQTLSLAPHHADAFFSRALIEKSSAKAVTLSSIHEALNTRSQSPLKQGKLHLAAAWCQDGKDLKAQFAHLYEAAELFDSVFAWNFKKSRQQFEAITGFIDRTLIDTLRDAGDATEKPIYIAAMPRSGTTLLEQILGKHSQCTPIGESQLVNHAISRIGFDLERPTAYWEWGQGSDFAPILDRLNDYYRQQRHVVQAGERRIVDKSLDNYLTAGLILLSQPNARIIHLQRHPLDTILSIYQLYIEMGPNIPFRLIDLAKHYQIFVDYMSHWKKIFPERVFKVTYEELVTHPEDAVKNILAFCELGWEDTCLDFYKLYSSVNTPSALQVKQKIHTRAIHRWKPYRQYLRPAAEVLGISI